MRKLLMVIMILCLCAGCRKQTEEVTDGPVMNREGDMSEIEVNGEDFSLHLDLSDGTGYEWLVVAQSDNLEISDAGFCVDRSDDPTSTGGSGLKSFDCRAEDEEDSWLILKCARPWEGQGDHRIYSVRMKDGTIDEIRTKNIRLYADMTFAYTKDEEIYFCIYLPNAWGYEEYQKDGQMGFLVHPEGKVSDLKICLNREQENGISEGKRIMISDQEYTVVTDEASDSFLLSSKQIFCSGKGCGWLEENILELICVLDSASFE